VFLTALERIHRAIKRLERGIKLLTLRATALRESGLSATATAHHLRDILDQIPCMGALSHGRRVCGNDNGAAPINTAPERNKGGLLTTGSQDTLN
jgi:hypothetical protein